MTSLGSLCGCSTNGVHAITGEVPRLAHPLSRLHVWENPADHQRVATVYNCVKYITARSLPCLPCRHILFPLPLLPHIHANTIPRERWNSRPIRRRGPPRRQRLHGSSHWKPQSLRQPRGHVPMPTNAVPDRSTYLTTRRVQVFNFYVSGMDTISPGTVAYPCTTGKSR